MARMTRPNVIKSAGYGVSILSVLLLGAPSLKTAVRSPLLLTCLVLGVLASLAGMVLRWWSYQIDQD